MICREERKWNLGRVGSREARDTRAQTSMKFTAVGNGIADTWGDYQR